MKKINILILTIVLLFYQFILILEPLYAAEISTNNAESEQELKIKTIDLNDKTLQEHQKKHLYAVMNNNSIQEIIKDKIDTFEKYNVISKGKYTKINLQDGDFAVYEKTHNFIDSSG